MANNSQPPAEPPDDEIIKKIKASNEEGMRALLRIHGEPVKDILTKKHGYHVACEAINRAALVIWLDLASKYRPGEGTLRGWFFQIAHRKAIDIRRGEKRERFLQLDIDPQYDPSKCDDKAYQEEKAENAQRRELRNEATRRIVRNLSRVLRIVTECDMNSAHDIAEVEVIRIALGNPNASNGSIDTARCKARAIIRAEITKLGNQSSDAGRRNYA